MTVTKSSVQRRTFCQHQSETAIMHSQKSTLIGALLPALLSQVHAEFTANCAPLTIQRGDPIVFPGQISPHVHIVTGGTAFQLTQPNEVAVGARATTCDKILDNSNYWQPQLYHQRSDGRFEIVEMQGNVCVPGCAILHSRSLTEVFIQGRLLPRPCL